MKFLLSSTIPTSLRTFYADMLGLLRAQGYDVAVVSSPGQELDALAAEQGVRTLSVEMKRQIAPLSDLRSLWRLWRLMRKERPDVVHSMTPKAGLLVMTAAKLAGVPVRMHTFTGLVFPTSRGLKRTVLKLTDRITCACATHVIPEGEGVRHDLIANHITRKPIRVIGHGNVRGIDMEHYAVSKEIQDEAEKIRQRTGGSFVFIFIGRIVADKGIRELAEAFNRLYSENPDMRLIMLGRREPDLDPLDDKTVSTLESCPGIIEPGQQKDIRPWLAASDALAFPSYREGFPNVVIEAGAMGLPSVVTDINGSREIITDGFNGLIVKPHSTEALYNAMRRMAYDRDACRRMAEVARPHIADRWEQRRLRRLQLEFYQKALETHNE